MRIINYIIPITVALTLGLASCQTTPDKYLEEAAINDLDALTQNMGNLTACSFTITVSEFGTEEGEPVLTKKTDAYIKGPRQMFFYSTLSNGERRGVWYNEDELSIYLFDQKKFQTIPAPKNLIQAIDSINRNLNFEFPAADFFYPTFTDDVIAFADSVFYYGNRELDGENFVEVYAKNAVKDIYILIDEAENLPKQLEIYSKDETYVATFTNWQTNPNLPDEMFQFSPPEGAEAATIINKD